MKYKQYAFTVYMNDFNKYACYIAKKRNKTYCPIVRIGTFTEITKNGENIFTVSFTETAE